MKINFFLRIITYTIFVFLLFSCDTNRVTSYKKTSYKKIYTSVYSKPLETYRSSNTNLISSRDVNKLLKTAKSYLGVPYKYGGTNSNGFDCSGLVYVSFKELNLELPRISKEQANVGKEISAENLKTGDLIFFNTSGNLISHVGIVESIEKNGEINFIHSSTSKGVIISSLDENYWRVRFVKAVRLL